MKRKLLTLALLLVAVIGAFALANNKNVNAANTDVWGLIGTMNGWDLAAIKDETTYNSATGRHELTVKIEKNAEFKFLLKGNGYTWNNVQAHARDWAGYVGTNDANFSKYFKGSDNFICLETNTYKFSFDNAASGWGDPEWGLSVEVVVVKTTHELLVETLTSFYNNGSYTKASSIKVDKNKLEEELAVYFHAGASALERTTVYEDGKLTMTADGKVAGYKTVENDMVRFHLEGEVEFDDYTVKGTTVEAYYVTLHDFLQASSTSNYGSLDLTTGWTVNGGVYTNTNADVLKAFELFVAPMWVGGNYVTYTKATVSVVDGELVMQLWASSTNSGLFADGYQAVDGNYLFAEAKIA